VWIALCNSLSLRDERHQANHLSAIAQIHTELMATCRTAMH
jgi:hypothetical protein